ncbi:MAG: hypothetical protein Q9168_007475 [Polycauliona sp. 1 TL-2023]
MSTEDEGDDVEIHLQRVSAKVISELTLSIPLFLQKKSSDRTRYRKFVRSSSTAKIERLINTFQEWPQLLDPALERLVQPLVAAFVDYIQSHASNNAYRKVDPDKPVDPLPRAICKLLYTFCKVRGSKVISRFFKNDPGILEPMLDAFESWDGLSKSATGIDLIWEEKYVMLLWLSHLALTPFDLESISTPTAVGTAPTLPPSISLPQGLPTVGLRLLALGLRYVSSAGKERDAAVLLLVRLSLRPDMQRLQLHHQLLQWAFSSMDDLVGSNPQASIYFYMGVLSYVTGFLRSGDSQTVATFLVSIFHCIESITVNRAIAAIDILGSAVARKLVIKIYRYLAIHQLHLTSAINPTALRIDVSQLEDTGQLDLIFDHLLTSLEDKDSPVRLTASKALAVIAQKLDPDMTGQLVGNIVQSLEENVDPLPWHGLILTLSHLIYRRSTPQAHLLTIIQLLIEALNFEQRSPMGISIGANVRDAACFGIWSVARKYSTAELLSISTPRVYSKIHHNSQNSVIEFLAAELVLTATLDPEGNIRRGASAALQELVGRHPDMVPRGIQLIQTVDYHAVGLRSRAMNELSFQAVELDKIYLDTIVAGILSWRAINSPVAAVRKDAAGVLGHLVGRYGVHPSNLPLWQGPTMYGTSKISRQKKDKPTDEWHGIYLAHAALICEGVLDMSLLVHRAYSPDLHLLLIQDGIFGPEDVKSHSKDKDLAIEALCTMISAVGGQPKGRVALGRLKYHIDILEACFKHCTEQTLDIVKTAAVSTIELSEVATQGCLVSGWLINIRKGCNGQLQSGGSNVSLLAVVGAALQVPGASLMTGDIIVIQVEVLITQLRKESSIESKCAALNHLFLPVFNRVCHDFPHLMPQLQEPLLDCLNDHTIDSRGDIGSEVRIAAINVLTETTMWDDDAFCHEAFGLVYGLAVEKLDKVRACAWSCLRKARLSAKEVERSTDWSIDSVEYFTFFLSNAIHSDSLAPMLRGFITTASVGSELLVRNTRIALLQSLSSFSPTEISSIHETLIQIILSATPAQQPTTKSRSDETVSQTRLLRPALEVFAFIHDNDTSPPQSRNIESYRPLLAPLRAVHATTDLPTLQALVSLYGALLVHADLRVEVMGVLYQLLLHRYPTIRLAAAGALDMAFDTPGLRELDLGTEKGELRASVQRLLKETKQNMGVG